MGATGPRRGSPFPVEGGTLLSSLPRPRGVYDADWTQIRNRLQSVQRPPLGAPKTHLCPLN